MKSLFLWVTIILKLLWLGTRSGFDFLCFFFRGVFPCHFRGLLILRIHFRSILTTTSLFLLLDISLSNLFYRLYWIFYLCRWILLSLICLLDIVAQNISSIFLTLLRLLLVVLAQSWIAFRCFNSFLCVKIVRRRENRFWGLILRMVILT